MNQDGNSDDDEYTVVIMTLPGCNDDMGCARFFRVGNFGMKRFANFIG